MAKGPASLLVIASVAAALTFSQHNASARVAQETAGSLDSKEPREIAWGAFHAGADSVQSAVPGLQRALDTVAPAPDRERLAATDAVLDALVRLHAQLPAATLLPYLPLRPVQTLILLSNSPDREPALLRLLTTEMGYRWLTTANVLLHDRARGLAAHLLSTLTLRLSIVVVDDGPWIGPGYAGSRPGGERSLENPPGYPPHARYDFLTEPRPGAVVLASGPQTIYYTRAITIDIPSTFHDDQFDRPSDADRLAYLDAMIEPRDKVLLDARRTVSVRWSTPEALVREVDKLRLDLVGQYRKMVDLLVRAGRLTSAEAAALPSPIDVQVVDRRKDQSVPLPIIRVSTEAGAPSSSQTLAQAERCRDLLKPYTPLSDDAGISLIVKDCAEMPGVQPAMFLVQLDGASWRDGEPNPRPLSGMAIQVWLLRADGTSMDQRGPKPWKQPATIVWHNLGASNDFMSFSFEHTDPKELVGVVVSVNGKLFVRELK